MRFRQSNFGFCRRCAATWPSRCTMRAVFRKNSSSGAEMSREANEARKIQQALLPRSSPYIPGFAISGLSTPAGAVGGDWYDFIPFADGRWGLVLADVSGKGTAAALADVGNSRHASLFGGGSLQPERGADQVESVAGQ